MTQLKWRTQETHRLKQVNRFTVYCISLSVGQGDVTLCFCIHVRVSVCESDAHWSVLVLIPKQITWSQRQKDGTWQTRGGQTSVERSELHIQVCDLCVPLGMPSPSTDAQALHLGTTRLWRKICWISSGGSCAGVQQCEVWTLTLGHIAQILWLSSDMSNPLLISQFKELRNNYLQEKKRKEAKAVRCLTL